jgi:hypothetical protein
MVQITQHITKRRFIRLGVICFVLCLTYWFYSKKSGPLHYRDPTIYGIVADKETAVKIAETIWLPMFGEIIYNSRPFVATLNDSVWIVKGTLHAERGGTPYVEISKKDCRILKVLHGK